ncbi:MAG TPA: DUF1924 domain-containing protein [Gallionellaceae bacterium]|nr:DUF1924 domain-containing protein [Gallionellaceae bacterium]
MLRRFYTSGLALIAAAGLVAQPAWAETPSEMLSSLQQEAAAAPGFQGFSSTRGESFFKARHGNEWSCSSCHTENPAALGRHAKTGKVIEPLAPSANAERFTNPKKVEKWFKRNCNDVLDRVCTAQEKGDVLAYLLSLKK